MKLAILIPTLTERKHLFERCYNELTRQINALENPSDVKIFPLEDQRQHTTGAKRNDLKDAAYIQGYKYGAFLDDDDMPRENYIKLQLEVANSGLDCGSLWGQIYWNGKPGKPFHHSVVYTAATEDDKFYYRAPNHLNAINLHLVRDIRFQDKNFGEDGCWMEDIQKARVLKTEYQINEIIYDYFCGHTKYKL